MGWSDFYNSVKNVSIATINVVKKAEQKIIHRSAYYFEARERVNGRSTSALPDFFTNALTIAKKDIESIRGFVGDQINKGTDTLQYGYKKVFDAVGNVGAGAGNALS